MGCDAFWKRLAEIVSASPEAQATELVPVVVSCLEAMCAHAAGGGGSGVGEGCWQLGCLLALVFDAIPLATHTAAPLALAAQRAQALATALATAPATAPAMDVAHHSAAQPEDDGYREAAAMLLWRAGVALERGCSELLQPGSWGAMRPLEPPTTALVVAKSALQRCGGLHPGSWGAMRPLESPAALVVAQSALQRCGGHLSSALGGSGAEGKGGRRGGGKGGTNGSASYAEAAVHLAASDAVAYAASWSHLDLVVMSTPGLFTPSAGLFTPSVSSSSTSAPAEDAEDETEGDAAAERAASVEAHKLPRCGGQRAVMGTVEAHKDPTRAGRKRRNGSSSAESAVAGAHESAVVGAHESAERLARRAAKRQKGVRRWLKEHVALLVTWSPAEAKLAATSSAALTAAAVTPGCAAPLRAFASRWALAVEHAPLLDAYASASDLRRWLSVLWTAVCATEGAVVGASDLAASAAGAVTGAVGMAGSGACAHHGAAHGAHHGAAHGAQHGAPQSVRAVSWRLLQKASTYELPRVRAALLPSAWRWLRRHLPAEECVRSRHVRAQLRFVLDGAATVEGGEAGDGAGDEAGGEAGGAEEAAANGGGEATEQLWSKLLGKRGAESLPIRPEQWRCIGHLLAILSRLPLEWVPLEQVR